MELTYQQQNTITHLKEMQGITAKTEIIKFCQRKLKLPQRNNHRKTPANRVPGRKHSRKHYQGIIDFLLVI